MLMPAVVGSMIFIKNRQMMEVFPQQWRKLWKAWELRGMILISLTAQIVLIGLGSRRKYISTLWIRVTVWSAYLLADYVAAMAAGIISNDLGEFYMGGGCADAKNEYTAFWTPLLLSHLGGTDSITAYSLEDNELWKRHLFGLITQAMATFYILLMSWGGSTLSVLFIVMFFVGLFKYWERVLILYSASEKQFRDSISDIPTNDSKIMEECKLKQLEGYYLTTHLVLEVHHSTNTSTVESVPHAKELLTAYSLLEMVKRLIADLILGFQDRDASRAIFERINFSRDAYRIIEIELGLVYDMLYTKAKVIYSFWGIARRIIGIFLTSIVLVAVCLNETLSTEKQHHSKIDFTLTLVLLVVALLLEFYAIVELLRSDQTAHWLLTHNKTTILQLISITLRPNWASNSKCRWSNSIGQFSLLSFSQSRKALPCHGILKMLGVDEMLDIYQYGTSVPLEVYVKQTIFGEIKYLRSWAEVNDYGTDLKALYGCRGGRTLKKYNRGDLEWSINLEFDQSILIWHLATEICYYADYVPPERMTLKPGDDDITNPGDEQSTRGLRQRISKFISRYMLYLLVQHPEMLPIGMAHIRFRDIYTELSNFVQEQMSNSFKEKRHHGDKKSKLSMKISISKMLKKVKTNVMLTARGGDRSNFVIFHACKLVSAFGDKRDVNYWQIIMNVWVEILGHAASQCKGRHHAQQLRRGGEFLTHVWLLMAHFGLTDHFQVPRSRAIAEAILK